MSTSKGQFIQIYYEIAMSIGMSLDLDEMTRSALFAYTRKLNCCMGVILKRKFNHKDGSKAGFQIFSVPRKESQPELISRAIAGVEDHEERAFGDKSFPVIKKCVDPLTCHMMELPGFGYLLLFKNGNVLPRNVLHSLDAINRKLASFCLACESRDLLVNSEAKYRRIFENVRDIYVEIELPSRRIIEISPSVFHILGYSQQELIGRNPALFFENQQERETVQEILLAEQHVVDFESTIYSKSGEKMVFSISASIHRNEPDRHQRLVGVLRDIGRRKVAEEALLDSRNRLEEQVLSRTAKLLESNRSLEAEIKERIEAEENLKKAQTKLFQSEKMASIGQLATGIAHEINNPIQYIGTHVRFLAESSLQLLKFMAVFPIEGVLSKDPDLRKKYDRLDVDYLNQKIPESLKQAVEGVEQISSIVQGMNMFAHSGEQEKTDQSINEIIENTLKISRDGWKDFVSIETSLSEDLPYLSCVKHSIAQVVLNLLLNAVHAIEERVQDEPSLKGVIRVETRLLDEHVVFSLSDNGSGMKVEQMNRVFEPFYTTKPPGRGTGQGLSIVYSIVTQEYGGTIDVSSEYGKGSQFVVVLPVHLDSKSI